MSLARSLFDGTHPLWTDCPTCGPLYVHMSIPDTEPVPSTCACEACWAVVPLREPPEDFDFDAFGKSGGWEAGRKAAAQRAQAAGKLSPDGENLLV